MPPEIPQVPSRHCSPPRPPTPRDPRIPYARATIHAQLGQVTEARTAVRRALELDPGFPEAARLLQQLQ